MVDFSEIQEKMEKVKELLNGLNEELETASDVCEGMEKVKDKVDIDDEEGEDEVSLPKLLLSEIEGSMQKANEKLTSILSILKKD